MPCTITDKISTFSANNTITPVVGAQVIVTALYFPGLWAKNGGVWYPVENPIVQLTTDSNGMFTYVGLWPSELDPTNALHSFTLPNGTVIQGQFPEGNPGSLSTHDLKATFGWTLASQTPTQALAIQGSGQPAAPIYSDSTRPAANAVGASVGLAVPIWNSSSKTLNFSDGVNWYDQDGNVLQ
jgi:hypothetical protein